MKKLNQLFSVLAIMTNALMIVGFGSTAVCAAVGHVEFAPILTTVIYSGVVVSDYQMPKLLFSAPFAFTEGICPNLQIGLNDLLGSNAPEAKRTPVGYLQAITSPMNTGSMTQIPVDVGTGKKKLVDVTLVQRGTEDDFQDTYNNGCTPEISKTPFEDTVEVTNVLSSKGIAFSEDEMRKLCEDDQTWIARIINAEMDAFMVRLDKRLITEQNTNFGNYANGSASVQSFQMMNTAAGSARYMGEVGVLNAFEDIYANNRPMLIGQGNLRDYTMLQKIGCCNDQGIDIGRTGGFDYFRDPHVGAITGDANDVIGIAPGHMQFLSWNKYRGKYAKNYGNIIKTTIMDPYTGLMLDMRWKYDDCDEVWILTFSIWFEPWFLPANAFKSGDPLEGVNYTLKMRATTA